MQTNHSDIETILLNPEDVYIVHCSCGTTVNKKQALQRIYCIYVKNLNSSHSERFSIEHYASKNAIGVDDIEDWYADLEIYLLDDFNTFLKGKSNCSFVYWAEDGQDLVLDMIKARYDEINKDSVDKTFQIIPISNRKSIQILIKDVHGIEDGADDLKQFIKTNNKNKIINGFLTNEEEGVCFDKKEFHRINLSVTSKADFFIKTIRAATKPNNGKDAKDPIDFGTISLLTLLKKLNTSSWLTLVGVIIGIFMAGFGISQYYASLSDRYYERKINDLEDNLNNQQKSMDKQVQPYLDTIIDLRRENETLQDQKSLEDSSKVKEIK